MEYGAEDRIVCLSEAQKSVDNVLSEIYRNTHMTAIKNSKQSLESLIKLIEARRLCAAD